MRSKSALQLLLSCLLVMVFSLYAQAKELNLSVINTTSASQQIADNSGWVPDTNDTSQFLSSCTLEYNFLDDEGNSRILQLVIAATDSGGAAKIQNVSGGDNGLNVYGNINRPNTGEVFNVTVHVFDGGNDVTSDYGITILDIESYVNPDSSGTLGWVIESTEFQYVDQVKTRRFSDNIVNGPLAMSGNAFDMTPNTIAGQSGDLMHWDGIKLDVSILRNEASIPTPADGQTEVATDSDLGWNPGMNVQASNGHDVFLGTDFNDVLNATAASHPNVTYANVSDPTFDPGILAFDTTYYWRVDEINGATTWTGDVWEFATISGKATSPAPADAASNISKGLIVLQWTPSPTAFSQDVFFGVDYDEVNTAVTPDVSGLNGSTGNAGVPAGFLPLEYGRDYFWRVDTDNGAMGDAKGEIWSFTVEFDIDNSSLYVIDPGNRLVDNSGDPAGQNPFRPGTWNNDGNLDGWTTNNLTDIDVSGGSLTATGSANSPYIQLMNMSNGPDLDFGYFDFLQFRMKLPAGFNDDIKFYFGTSTQNGIDTGGDRTFSFPAEIVPDDGDWHTYRIDLGLVVWWRDTLDDIRIYPLGDSGNAQTFSIDYVEFGDLEGDVLLLNTNLNFTNGETLADCDYLASKHGAIWWSPSTTNMPNDTEKRRALRMIEESYQVFCKMLGYVEPFTNTNGGDDTRYKTNQTTWYNGFWMGAKSGFAYFNVNAGGLKDEGWGNPVPHEFGHVVQGHQPGKLTGGHWESHTNFMREARNKHFQALFGTSYWPGINLRASMELQNVHQDHKRLIYQDYRIHRAIQHHAEELGLSKTLVSEFWTEPPELWTVYDKMAQMLPAGYDIKDVVASCMRHWPLLDMKDDSVNLQNRHWSTAEEKSNWFHRGGSHLIPSQDKAGWFRVPFARAPEKFANMHHELTPTSDTVTVEFAGFDVLGADEDWRWSLAATDNNYENPRFSELWGPGEHSFTLLPGETRLFLIVVATPADTSLDLDGYHNIVPKDKDIDRLRYPYEVRLVNAVPAPRQYQRAKGSGGPHPNGGGWVDNSASVDASAYVGPNAMVLDNAQVTGNARIEDYAVVMDSAKVQNNAVVSGFALIRNNAIVRDNAKVRDRGMNDDKSGVVIENNSVVEEFAVLGKNMNMKDYSIARGICLPWESTISGDAILDYDYSSNWNFTDGVQFDHIPWGGWYETFFAQTQTKPRGLVASYRIETPNGQIVWDEFGAKHAIARGGAERVYDNQLNSEVLRLDGVDNYVVLDRSLCDFLEGSFSLWVKPTDNTDVPLLFMGSSASKYLELALDQTGLARFTISNGTTTGNLSSSTTVPGGVWTHLAVTLDGNVGALYVNGAVVAQQVISLKPDEVLGANDYSQPEALYIGRNWTGDLFSGDIEDIRFYNVALQDDELLNEYLRSGDILGVFFADQEQDFNGSSTTFQSGVKDGLVRTLDAEIYPETSDNVTYYEAIFDSTCEASQAGNNIGQGSGFGLDNGQFKVRLPSNGFWNTGVNASLNQWQRVTLSYDGSTARFYVNGVLRATKNYNTNEASLPNKNFRIGFAMDTSENKYYFDGKIRNVFIYGQQTEIDAAPPTPDPAQWQVVPQAQSDSSITMTAKPGVDAGGFVQYYFEETSGNPGGSDSGWQSSPVYVDENLLPMTEYQYVVRMRDKLGNITGDSQTRTALTGPVVDMNGDGIVNLADFNRLGGQWLNGNCAQNNWCNGTDLDMKGVIGIPDLLLLSNDWMQEIGGSAMKLSTGVISISSGINWTTVTLPYTYESMVVIATPAYEINAGPAVLRIRNAGGNSFEIRADKAVSGGDVAFVEAHYMVVEEGVYNVAEHGVKMEAVKYLSTVTDDNDSWIGEPRSYGNTYISPVVLGQVMTFNDSNFSYFWNMGPDTESPPTPTTLVTGKAVGEDPMTTRANEMIGYIVIEAGSGLIGNTSYSCAVGSDTVMGFENEPPYAYDLTSISNTTAAIATLTAKDGTDGGWAVLYGNDPLSDTQLQLVIDEDQVNDDERAHTEEQVAYIVFGNE